MNHGPDDGGSLYFKEHSVPEVWMVPAQQMFQKKGQAAADN